jgi:hypothetical protein
MAAVIELRTGTALDQPCVAGSPRPTPTGEPSGSGTRPTGGHPAPALRLVHGGRSAHARQLRRTYWVRRLAVVLLAVVVAWVGVQAVTHALMPIGAGAAPTVQPGAVHTVQPGDTLWALASAIDPQADPRDTVQRIVELNQGGPALSTDGALLAGEQLRLPAGD